MAINPETSFVGKITAASAEYPYGKARDVTVPGDGTGTPWVAQLLNDLFGFQQALLSGASIVPSGSPDEVGASEYLQALKIIAGSRVADYAAMRALDSAEVRNDQLIFVTDDGVAGVFKVKAGTVTDNGGTLIVFTDDSARYAERVVKGAPSVKWFGAVGDGAADDTAAIQAAVDAFSDGVIELPDSSGDYNIDTALTGTADVTFLAIGTALISGTGVALTVATVPINTIYYEGAALVFDDGANAPNQIVTGPRGLVVLNNTSNTSSAVNCVPNGVPVGLNKAQSNLRLWAQDIVLNPNGSRQALAKETHRDTDDTMRGRTSTRSEGLPELKHLDYYWQINGNNCLYVATARGGVNLSAISMGFFPLTTSFKVDFQTTEGGESSTGATNFWLPIKVVVAGDEKALFANDYQYLECTTGGTTDATEPGLGTPGGNGQVGTENVADGTAVWRVRSRLQEGGNLDAKPAMWMDESGNTGFGTMNPQFAFDYADVVNFQVIARDSSTDEVAAAGVSSLDNATLLTTAINEVDTVAVNAGVRLPTAAKGQKVSVFNNGANTLKIWPFNGDDLGAGANTNVTLAVGAATEFHCYSSTNWYELS